MESPDDGAVRYAAVSEPRAWVEAYERHRGVAGRFGVEERRGPRPEVASLAVQSREEAERRG